MKIVFFDLETGGLTAAHPDIQLAAVATEQCEEIDSFEAKIRFDPERADPEALKLNSYDPGVWSREAQDEREVVEAFSAFLRKHADLEMLSQRTGRPYKVARLAGHNAATFDAPRLQKMFRRHQAFLPASFQVLDTLQLALWHGASAGRSFRSYKLSALCSELGLDSSGAHDALADVRMCMRLANALRPRETGAG